VQASRERQVRANLANNLSWSNPFELQEENYSRGWVPGGGKRVKREGTRVNMFNELNTHV
jgi:hypothetical protein